MNKLTDKQYIVSIKDLSDIVRACIRMTIAGSDCKREDFTYSVKTALGISGAKHYGIDVIKLMEVDYVKYAEEAGAACEEMKHGIEEVIKEIDHYFSPRLYNGEIGYECQNGAMHALDIVKKHLSKYLDE